MSENSKPGIALYIGFVAWLAYSALGAWGYWKTAACAGLVIMLEIVAWEVHARRVKIIDCTSLGFFFLAIVALVTLGEGYFIRYQVVFGWGLFAAVAWITMIAGVPFRLQYARERTPRDRWNEPGFRGVHFRVSVAWAIIFTFDTALGAIALDVGHRSLLVVIMPGASMLIGGALTLLYPAYYRYELAPQLT